MKYKSHIRTSRFFGAVFVIQLFFLAALSAQPVWENDYLIGSLDYSTPWRTDFRLKDKFTEKEYPDDVMVLFEHPDENEHLAGHSEYMWVSIFSYDEKADLFLGKLINQPHYLESVGENDNVVFKISDQSQTGLQALGKETGYSVPGWPKQATSKHHKKLIRGIKSYRAGAFGHNMQAIKECIRSLTPLDQKIPASFDVNDQFTLHFVLGRCYAESYQTVDAITQFEKCISFKPENFNAHMCLLAEYSVMVHTPKKDLKVGSEQQWEDAFVKQHQLIKQKFPNEDLFMMEVIFNEKMVEDIDSYSEDQLERARKVGFATFRWKKI